MYMIVYFFFFLVIKWQAPNIASLCLRRFFHRGEFHGPAEFLHRDQLNDISVGSTAKVKKRDLAPWNRPETSKKLGTQIYGQD